MPAYTLTIRDEAETDVESAYEWYEEQRTGLGDEFLVAVDEAIDRIRRGPLTQLTFDARFHCTLLKRFPYVIYFTVESQSVIVFAVLHGRRDPSIPDERLST